jgi:hypothetical protein
MNEAETRAELIDPKLKINGWGVAEGSKILRAKSLKVAFKQAVGAASPLLPIIFWYIKELNWQSSKHKP